MFAIKCQGVLLALPLGIFGLFGLGAAQERTTDRGSDAAEVQATDSAYANFEVIVFPVRSRSARNLRNVLSEVYQEDPRVHLIASSDDPAALIVRVHTSQRDAVMQVLTQLDMAARPLLLQLLVVEAEAEVELPEEGSVDELRARIEALREAGTVRILEEHRCSSLENVPASVSSLRSEPRISGRQVTPRGEVHVATNVEFGTTFDAICRLTESPDLLLGVEIEYSAPSPPSEENPELGGGMTNARIVTTLRLANRHMQRVHFAQTADKRQLMFYVAASLRDDGPPATPARRDDTDDARGRRSAADGRTVDDRYVEYARRYVERYDLNDDGVLAGDELQRTRIRMDQVDQDGDGEVTVDEMIAFVRGQSGVLQNRDER